LRSRGAEVECPAWPGLESAPVTVGGLTVTAVAACAAATALEASRTSAVAPVIARTPLAGCDFLSAAGPHLPWSASRDFRRDSLGLPRRGAAGRHVVKDAVIAAIAAAVAQARAVLAEEALQLIGTDERYAAAIASATARVPRPGTMAA